MKLPEHFRWLRYLNKWLFIINSGDLRAKLKVFYFKSLTFDIVFGDRCKRVSAQHQVAYCYTISVLGWSSTISVPGVACRSVGRSVGRSVCLSTECCRSAKMKSPQHCVHRDVGRSEGCAVTVPAYTQPRGRAAIAPP